MPVGDGPEDGLESVEAGGDQGCTTHNQNEDPDGTRPAHKSGENLADPLVHESQAQHMNNDSQNDQG